MRSIVEWEDNQRCASGLQEMVVDDFSICLHDVAIIVKKLQKTLHCSNLRCHPWFNIPCHYHNLLKMLDFKWIS